MNENKDLIDLWRLDLMEENAKILPDHERGLTLNLIERQKRRLAEKIINDAPKPSCDAMDNHIKQNTKNGIYPWTDAMDEIEEDE